MPFCSLAYHQNCLHITPQAHLLCCREGALQTLGLSRKKELEPDRPGSGSGQLMGSGGKSHLTVLDGSEKILFEGMMVIIQSIRHSEKNESASACLTNKMFMLNRPDGSNCIEMPVQDVILQASFVYPFDSRYFQVRAAAFALLMPEQSLSPFHALIAQHLLLSCQACGLVKCSSAEIQAHPPPPSPPPTSQHNTTQHNTTQHNTTQHNTTQHNTTQHNTTQHNTTQIKLIQIYMHL